MPLLPFFKGRHLWTIILGHLVFRKLHLQWNTIALIKSTFWNKQVKKSSFWSECHKTLKLSNTSPLRESLSAELKLFHQRGKWRVERREGKECECYLVNFLRKTPLVLYQQAGAAVLPGAWLLSTGSGDKVQQHQGEAGSPFTHTFTCHSQSSEWLFSLILRKSNLGMGQTGNFLESNDFHYKPKVKMLVQGCVIMKLVISS